VRGNQVFGVRFCVTTDGITSTDDSFPDEDFFPNISSLYIDDMADDAGANANANLNANVNPPTTPYAICSYRFQFLLQFLVLAFGVDVICLSMLDVICSSILLVCMIRLIPVIIIMLYYWLFRIKSYGKLLIYSKETSSIKQSSSRVSSITLIPSKKLTASTAKASLLPHISYAASAIARKYSNMTTQLQFGDSNYVRKLCNKN
jgi:hypothetical protein